MINVFRKIKLPLLILFLLLNINTLSCKVVFWGQDLGKLNKDFVTTCYFYRDSTADSPSIKIDYMIGETYSIPEFTNADYILLEKPGYTVSGWGLKDASQLNENFQVDASGNIQSFKVTYKSYEFVPTGWSSYKDTEYKIEHYKQNLDGKTYTLADTDYCRGETGQNAVVYEYSYTGFTIKPYTTEPIAGNGSTVIKVYYDRNIYKILYKYQTDVPMEKEYQCMYEEEFPIFTEVPPLEDLKFDFWGVYNTHTNSYDDFIFPSVVTEDVTLTAQYIAIFTLKFNLNGGTTTTVFDDTETDGSGNTVGIFKGTNKDALKPIATPVKTNMTFQYWTKDGERTAFPATFTEDAEYTAHYELNTQTVGGFTVTFPAAGTGVTEDDSAYLIWTSQGTNYTFSVEKEYDTYIWSINGIVLSSGNESSYDVPDFAALGPGSYEIMAVCYDSAGKAYVYIQNFKITKDTDLGGGI